MKKVLNNLYLIRRMSYISYELGCSNGISQTSPRSIMDEAKILIKVELSKAFHKRCDKKIGFISIVGIEYALLPTRCIYASN